MGASHAGARRAGAVPSQRCFSRGVRGVQADLVVTKRVVEVILNDEHADWFREDLVDAE
eukprot:CAMPEP_0195646910 /NCGR_PEP_ID=MMETSP0815-20121206/29798_1 /TAXON_ID=97485 /ORGANISM="Prymnesium parvum, Strain Texoma1" /LENGTH=58 /DNA_ID=CAMNT_0040790405 /DNA_START=768 /DNA_END=945 /DNA_ORIENTATION=+